MVSKALKVVAFILVAALFFAAGVFAFVMVKISSPRGWMPESGVYSGGMHLMFHSDGDSTFNLRCRSRSSARVYWRRPWVFEYREVQLEWWRISEHSESEGTGSLQLPSMQYVNNAGTGVLTETILAGWLLGETNNISAEERRQFETILQYLKRAGDGSLPGPRHHSYSESGPVDVRLVHGVTGVPGPLIAWFGIWLILTLGSARWLWVGRRGAPEPACTPQH